MSLLISSGRCRRGARFGRGTAGARQRDASDGRIEALERELVQRQDVVNRALQAHNDMRQKQAELLKDFDVRLFCLCCFVLLRDANSAKFTNQVSVTQ